MHYIIDGYNLLFSQKNIPSLQEARKALLENIFNASFEKNISITIIFDAHQQETPLSLHNYHHLKIIFTEHNQTADEFIVHYIQSISKKSNLIVVSDDKTLTRHVRHSQVKTMALMEFLSFINKKKEARKHTSLAKWKSESYIKKTPEKIPSPKEPPTKIPSDTDKEIQHYLHIFESQLPEKKKKIVFKETNWLVAFSRNSCDEAF